MFSQYCTICVPIILSALRAGLGWGRGAQSEDYVQVQCTLVVNTADNIDGPPGIAAKTMYMESMLDYVGPTSDPSVCRDSNSITQTLQQMRK